MMMHMLIMLLKVGMKCFKKERIRKRNEKKERIRKRKRNDKKKK